MPKEMDKLHSMAGGVCKRKELTANKQRSPQIPLKKTNACTCGQRAIPDSVEAAQVWNPNRLRGLEMN